MKQTGIVLHPQVVGAGFLGAAIGYEGAEKIESAVTGVGRIASTLAKSFGEFQIRQPGCVAVISAILHGYLKVQ